MARVEIGEVVLSSAGTPVSGASVQVNVRASSAATVYTTESGGGTSSNPITTDENGRIEGWLEEGSYDLVVSGTGLTTYTQNFEAVAGQNSPGKLLTTTGSMAYASSANTLARRAIGSSGDVLTVAGGLPTWAAPAAVSLTTAEAALSGDVDIPSSGTFVDGPSVSLAAGTWFIVASVHVENIDGSTNNAIAKLWDGSTVEASGQSFMAVTNNPVQITLAGIVAPGSTTTYKVSVTDSRGNATIRAATVTSGVGNNASYIRAVKIA